MSRLVNCYSIGEEKKSLQPLFGIIHLNSLAKGSTVLVQLGPYDDEQGKVKRKIKNTEIPFLRIPWQFFFSAVL